jgi:hypothetical protein
MRRRNFLRTLLVCLGVCWAAAPAERADAAAGEYRPLVVVSLASYEKIVGDLSRVIGPRQTAIVQGLLGVICRVPIDRRTMAPVGLDPRRPWGLVMETDGQTFPLYGFVPVTDLGTLLAGPVAARRIRAPDGGVYQIKVQGRTWYVGQKGGWAILATSRPGLASAPAKPEEVLRNMPRSYDVAVRVSLANLPADTRELARRWIDEQHHLVLDRRPGESAVEYRLRNALADQGLRRAADLAVEGDSLLAGLSLDLRTRSLIADAEVTYRPGSEMAQGLAAPSKSKTDFAGFLVPDAALTGVWTGEIARMPLYQLLALVDAAVGPLLEQLEGPPGRAGRDLWQAVRTALVDQSVDGGVLAVVRPGGATLAAGADVADPAKVRQALRALAEAVQKQPALSRAVVWQQDAGQYRGVRFHLLSIPLASGAKDRPGLARTFGRSVEVVVGIGNARLYMAAGRHPLELLKQAIRGSQGRTAAKKPPVYFCLRPGPTARLLADLGQGADRARLSFVAGLFEQSTGRDRVKLTGVPIKHGVHLRLEIEEGVFRAAVLGLIGNPRSAAR